MQNVDTWEVLKDGSYLTNEMKNSVTQYWMSPENSDGVTDGVVSLGAAGTPTDEVIADYFVEDNGHFEIDRLVSDNPDADIMVKIFDPGYRRFWHPQDQELHLSTISGRGDKPFRLPETYFMNTLRGMRQLRVTFRNRDPNPVQTRFYFVGRRWYQGDSRGPVQQKMNEFFGRKERCNIYFLTTEEPIILPAGGTVRAIIRADHEADTEVFKAMQATVIDGAPGTLVVPRWNYLLTEDDTNQSFMNNPVHVSNGWGNGEFPMNLGISVTALFERNFTWVVDLASESGVNDQEVFLTLAARRLWVNQ